MADKTPFAGMTRLAPGDPLSTDGYSFQFQNPTITDNLLKVGARTHRHDGHAALADPSAPPDVTLAAGVIPAATEIGVCYTLVDAWGGESLPSDVTIVATPDPLSSPNTEPELAIDYDLGGSLVIGSYTYAIAVMDASGGVTPVGPSSTIERDPGFATAKVTLSGLTDIVNASSGYAWRAYKAMNQSQMHFLASGLAATDTLVDDGTLCGNCTEGAPASNTTGMSAGVEVVVPSGYSASATAVRVYLGEDADFATPSFAEELTPAQAASGVIYATLAVEDGQPPDVATTVGGANKIDPDTDLLDWHWKRPVASAGALPTPADVGDVRLALDTGYGYFYNSASAWVPVKGQGSGHVILDDLAPMPPQPNLAFVGADVTNDPANGRTLVTITAGSGGAGGGGSSFAEVFAEAVGVNVAIPDNAAAIDTPNLNVTGAGDLGSDYRVEVEFYITHTYDSDLLISLVAPDGTVVQLVDGNLINDQQNFGTVWTDGQKVVITDDATDVATLYAPGVPDSGTALPIVGRFKPTGDLNTLAELPIAGNWKLRAQDTFTGDTGTIVSWGLRFVPLGGDDGGTKALADGAPLTFRTGGPVGDIDAQLYERPGRRLYEPFILGSEEFAFEAGAGTWDATNEVPTSTALKRMRWNAVPWGAMEARWHDAFEVDFPIALPSGAAISTIGVTRFGFMDEDDNFLYVEVEPSGTNLTAKVGATLADGLDRTITSTISTPAAGLTVLGTRRYAWLRFRRYRGIYVVQFWKEPPEAYYESVPLATTLAEIDTDSDLRDVRVNRVFGPGHKPAAFVVEVVPVGTTAPILFNFAAGANLRIKGYLADVEFSSEVVATTGRYEQNQATDPPGFDVVASSRRISWEYAIPFNNAFGDFLYFTREDNGMVHVQAFGPVTAGEATINGTYLPVELWPKRTVYVAGHYTDGTGGELIKIETTGVISRMTSTATKTLGFSTSYRALWGAPA